MSDNANAACEHGHQRRKCPYCEIADLERQLAEALASNAEMREALERYGWHDKDCDADHAQHYPMGPNDNRCTCGFDAALRLALRLVYLPKQPPSEREPEG